MTADEVFQALRDVARLLPSQQRFFVIGSQSIHASFPNPPSGVLTMSPEVDIYIGEQHEPEMEDKIFYFVHEHLGSESDYDVEHRYYVDAVKRGKVVPILPDGWRERAVYRRVDVPATEDMDAFAVDVFFLEIHDLIASKLAANRPKDRDFARAAFRQGLFEKDIVAERLALCRSVPALIDTPLDFLRSLSVEDDLETEQALAIEIEQATDGERFQRPKDIHNGLSQ